MKMKKVLAVILSTVLTCTMLASCGDSSSAENASSAASSSSSKAEASSAAESSTAEQQPTEYDTTVFTVSVPGGWAAAPVADLLKKFDGVTNPEQVYIIKGGKQAQDIVKYPYVWVTYYKDASSYMSSKGFYSDAEDIAPVEIGGKSWEGYKYTSSGFPGTCLTCTEGSGLWVCLFVLKNADMEITIQDEDVKTILSSLKVK